MYPCSSYVNMHIYYTILRIKKYYIIYIPCIICPFCSTISASISAQHSIFYSLSCVALYANNKTPEPIGHFILTINTGRNSVPYSVVIPACHLLISDFLLHDDSRLELDNQLLGRDYLDACYQPSYKVIIKFRYLAGLFL